MEKHETDRKLVDEEKPKNGTDIEMQDMDKKASDVKMNGANSKVTNNEVLEQLRRESEPMWITD